MRRILVVAVACVALVGCDPAPTVTATPSTLAPKCKEITTVTGMGAPAAEIRNVVLELQSPTTGTWKPYYWFRTGAPGETRSEIRKAVNADGTYSLTYYQPQVGSPTLRLRIRGMKVLSDPGVVSKSWYVTAPRSC